MDSKMKKIILLFLFAGSVFAQVEYSKGQTKGQFLPKFFIDLASYKSQTLDKTKIDVFIKVPYSNVQFLKRSNDYRAEYTLIISLYNDDDELKFEKLWTEKIATQIFKQTVSQNSYNVSYKSFLIDKGEYKLVCKLEDSESRKHSIFSQKIKIREFKDSLEISDPVLASGFVETESGKKIIPNISNLVTSADSSLSFFYEVYSQKPQETKIMYTIYDEEKNPLYTRSYDFVLQEGKNEIHETLNRITFSLGKYQLAIKLLDPEGEVIKGSSKKFVSKLFGFPESVKNLDKSVDQLQFIASADEVDEIEDTDDYKEKLKRFIAYWKRLDPSPNTVENETLNEYYRRVEYANANFKGYFNGWKSDMGMVYITLGPPDQVARRPYEMDRKPYEMWDYYIINRRFIFVDQTNFGDYRLENPAYGSWFRYRP